MKKGWFGAACLLMASVMGGEERLLRLSFPEGKSCALAVEMEQDLKQAFGPQAMETRQTMRLEYRLEGLPPDAEGNSVIRVSIDRVTLAIDSPMGKIAFDSRDPESVKAARANPMTAGFAALQGGRFSMTLTPRGEVRSVSGSGEIAERAARAVPEGPVREMVAGQFKAMYSDAAMRDQMGQFLPVYPEAPVKPGDRWTRKGRLQLGPVAIDQETSYTVARLGPDGADLAVEAVFSAAPADPAAEISFSVKNGTQKGTVAVGDDGLLRESSTRQRMECDVVAQGMTMSQTMDATVTVKRIAEGGAGEKPEKR